MPSESAITAMILAGGLGTRLRTIVKDRPKPMANIGERPFLEVQIDALRRYGIRDLILCVGYLHESIERHFGDGSSWDVRIQYSVEDQALGTAGALRLALPLVEGRFVALNGDSYLDTDIRKLVAFHDDRRAGNDRCLGCLALASVPDPRAYGLVRTGVEGRIESFEEKSGGSASASRINAGVYVLEPALLETVPAGREVSLEREIFPAVLDAGFDLYGLPTDGFFVDIGTPAGYAQFQKYAERRLT